MSRIAFALGTNVGHCQQTLCRAALFLAPHLRNPCFASWYETAPWGGVEQPNFLNTMVAGNIALPPIECLRLAKSVEQQLGRVPRQRNGPREIDVDVVLYDNLTLETAELVIPHPSLHLRDFVLVPLVELCPSWKHPILQRTPREILQALPSENHTILRRITHDFSSQQP